MVIWVFFTLSKREAIALLMGPEDIVFGVCHYGHFLVHNENGMELFDSRGGRRDCYSGYHRHRGGLRRDDTSPRHHHDLYGLPWHAGSSLSM
jgi:hypothetical protein